MPKFFKLDLDIDSLIIGERIKGGVFRPCIDTIPSVTIEGALYNNFGLDLKAVGILDKSTYEYAEFTYSITDRYTMVSKVPITTQYLKPRKDKIKASVYIPYNDSYEDIIRELKDKEFMLGAMKSKGFGRCKVNNITSKVPSDIVQGELNVRILEEECKDFSISVLASRYGYLFRPDKNNRLTGKYVRSLFEGSIVEAPKVLLKEGEYTNDED